MAGTHAPPTKTTGDQKTARQWLNKYGVLNINPHILALLRYLASNCYFQKPGQSHRERRDFEVSQYTLSKYMYCSLRSVQKHLDEAERLGFISIIKGADGKRDAYALHLDTEKHSGFKPTRFIEQEQKEARKKARSEYDKKRKAKLAKYAAEADPYEDLVQWAGINRGPRI
jgi:hypothetical protein